MSGYERENRNVLRRCLKTASDGAAVTWASRSFHTAAPEAVKLSLPGIPIDSLQSIVVSLKNSRRSSPWVRRRDPLLSSCWIWRITRWWGPTSRVCRRRAARQARQQHTWWRRYRRSDRCTWSRWVQRCLRYVSPTPGNIRLPVVRCPSLPC